MKFILFLIIEFLLFPAWTSTETLVQCAVEESVLARAHQFHGILVSTWVNGEYYFTRDGEDCQLFTDAAIGYIDEKGGTDKNGKKNR